MVLAAPAAFAATELTVVPMFPSPVTVGDTGVSATLQLTNTSTPPDNGNVNIGQIDLDPACGTTAVDASGHCPTASADPGVFQLSATATGVAGTACAGKNFTTSSNALGRVSFSAVGGNVVLGAPGTANATCTIAFTFDVLKVPAQPGSGVTNQIGFIAGTSATGTVASGNGFDSTQVLPAGPGAPLVNLGVATGVLSAMALAGGLVVNRRRRRLG
jgi:hypothetical protein